MAATMWASLTGRRLGSFNIVAMLLGGFAGFAIGGPISGVIGLVAGFFVDLYLASAKRKKRRRRGATRGKASASSPPRPIFDDPTETRRIAFATAIIVLSAKLAKADGVVSREEINAFKRQFMISDQDVGGIARIYDEAKRSAEGFEPYARQLAALFGRDPVLLEDLLIGLFEVAKADGVPKAGTLEVLREIATIFGFDAAKFQQLSNSLLNAKAPGHSLERPYQVLSLTRSASDAEIKEAYRKLVRELHPDQLIAKGMPEDFISRANNRLAAINAAYEQIVKQRGLK